MTSATDQSDDDVDESFYAPYSPPRFDRLVFWRSLRRGTGTASHSGGPVWTRSDGDCEVRLPINWPPPAWDVHTDPAPDAPDEEAIGQWFTFFLLPIGGQLAASVGYSRKIPGHRPEFSPVMSHALILAECLRPGFRPPGMLPQPCCPSEAMAYLQWLSAELGVFRHLTKPQNPPPGLEPQFGADHGPTASQPEPGRPKPNKNGKPSEDRQSDILAAIREKDMPLFREQIRESMKMQTQGKPGPNLSWMMASGILINIPQRGYWPADLPLPK